MKNLDLKEFLLLTFALSAATGVGASAASFYLNSIKEKECVSIKVENKNCPLFK